jgi:hypothetical protein
MQKPILPHGEFQASCFGAGRPSRKNWMGTLLTCWNTISPFVPTTKAVL